MASTSSPLVGPESFQYLHKLGEGVFGKVYKVKHQTTGEVCAMKILDKGRLEAQRLMKYAKVERNVMATVNHPYVVSLCFAFQTSDHFALVMQYCPGGDLASLIAAHGVLPENISKHYAAETLLGLEYLHGARILYRDLKPDNVVLDEDRHARLTDFGLAKEGVQHDEPASSFLGSCAYVAPEILFGKGHGRLVDVYNLGVLLFAMLSGKPPFMDKSRDKMWKAIKEASLVIPDDFSPDSSELLGKLLCRDPAERLGSGETRDVRSHKFFAEVDFDALSLRQVPVPEIAADASAQAPKAAAGQPCCRQGHLLVPTPAANNTTACDCCGDMQRRGAPLHNCKACDYDVCEACQRRETDPVAAAKWSQEQRRAIFGRGPLCGARFLQCLERPPTQDWDFVAAARPRSSDAVNGESNRDPCAADSYSSWDAATPVPRGAEKVLLG